VAHAGPVQRLRHYRHRNVVSHVTARTQEKRRWAVTSRTVVTEFIAANVSLLLSEAALQAFHANAMPMAIDGPMVQPESLVTVRLATRAPLDSVIMGTLLVMKPPR
jgi:hypothetical protein